MMTDNDLRAHHAGGGPGPGGTNTTASRVMARFDEGLNRLGLRSALARDCLLAVVMALLSSVMLWALMGFLANEDGVRLSPAATVALTVVMYAQSLILCVRRRNPVLCLVVVALAQMGTVALLPPFVAAQGISPFIAAYTCGALLPPRRLVWTLAPITILHGVFGTLVAGTLSDPILSPDATPPSQPSSLEDYLVLVSGLLAMAVVIYVGSAFVGAYTVARRRYVELTRVRAAEAIQRQRERAESAIMAERARMARELHDIAAHHLSGMVVQLGAAERLIGRDDQAAREATAWVRSQGRETLDSLRLVVGALRDPGEDATPSGDGLSHTGDPGARGAPVPGATGLERLVQTERDLGCSIALVREGEPYHLPPVADVTVYRVAQEALSNAREHAPNAPVHLLLHHRDTRVVLQVENGPGSGRGARGDKSANAPRGLGLLGMRERAQLVGAELEAGPTSMGGWRVRLDLPVSREVSSARNQSKEREAAE